ncbi:TPA: PTS sugar transporter subunit IIA [Escherichia coli]
MISISVADGAGLQNYDAVLEHIFNTHRTTNTVKESWLNAMRKREAEYPTGIELEGYSIAIPHCDSEHANQPSIYIIRLPDAIPVNRADEDGILWVRLVVNLIVTDPADQLRLLKPLFNHLQNEEFYQNLLTLPVDDAKALFVSKIIQ